jgi:triosephosphate isomerase (TIM)
MDKQSAQFSDQKKIRIIANWKSHKTAEETLLFLDTLRVAWPELPMENKEVIILPSFPSLSTAYVYKETEGLPVKIGAQDISAHDEGAYTGEANGRQLVEFCQFVLINHSERRRYEHETDQDARAKVQQALKYNLTPLFCIQNEGSGIPDGVTEVMFEPPSAISTFQEGAKVEDPEEIERVFNSLKSKNQNINLYYGGSISAENIERFIKIPEMEGFLVGGASLDIEKFAEILTAW